MTFGHTITCPLDILAILTFPVQEGHIKHIGGLAQKVTEILPQKKSANISKYAFT